MTETETPPAPEKLLSVAQVAERLNITPQRVGVLIRSDRLPAERVGRSWVVRESALGKVANRPKGWPKGKKRPKPA